MRVTKLVLVVSVLALLISSVSPAAEIAIVDYADQWTKVDALRQTLDEFKIKYDDYTKNVEKGTLTFKDENRLFFIGSMTTNNPKLHQSLDKNAKAIQDFAKKGGIVIEPTQADQNEANVDWLPDGLTCVRSDTDSADFKIIKPDHTVFAATNKMNEKSFQFWCLCRGRQGWPTV